MHVIIILLYFGFIAIVFKFSGEFGVGILGRIAITIALLLAPGWNHFTTEWVLWNFQRSHSPLQQISRTVEKPMSVLWIDEVWPGFDAYSRHWMVKNYLDGVHLQMLALNDGVGKIYLYQASPEDYAESGKLRPEIEATKKVLKTLSDQMDRDWKEKKNNKESGSEHKRQEDAFRPRLKAYEEAWERDLVRIITRAKVYPYTGGELPADLPSFAYRVQLHHLRLPEQQEQFVWCDQIDIVASEKQETIAFSKRCLGYKTRLPFFKEMGGSSPFSGGERLGDEDAYEFDDKVLFGYATNRSGYDGERSWKFSPTKK